MRRVTVGIDLGTPSRRDFLGVAAAGAALGPWTSARVARAATRLNVGYMKIGDMSPFFLALEKKFFEEAGLDINLAAMVGGAAIMPALASGAINIGWTNVVSLYQGHLQGFDYRLIANGAINKRGTHDVFGFQVAADSAIRTARDRRGRRSPPIPCGTSSTPPACSGSTGTGETPPRFGGWSCRSRRWRRPSSTARSTASWPSSPS